MSILRRLGRPAALGAVLFVFAVAGCVTVPPPAVVDRLVPAGGDGYFVIDVAMLRERIAEDAIVHTIDAALPSDEGTGGAGGVDRLVKRTDRVVGAFRVQAERSADIVVLATGRFPAGLTRLALRTNDAFARMPAPEASGVPHVYVHLAGGLTIAVLDAGLLAIATDDIAPVLSLHAARAAGGLSAASVAVDGVTLRADAVAPVEPSSLPIAELVVLHPEQQLLSRFGISIPIVTVEEVEFSVRAVPSSDLVELEGVFRFSGEREAGLFRRVSRGLVLVLIRALGIPVDNLAETVVIEQEGNDVRFGGIQLEADQALDVAAALVIGDRATGGER